MEKKLRITVKNKTSQETIATTIRMPKSLLKQIDTIAANTGYTRNELLNKCINFALNNLEIADE